MFRKLAFLLIMSALCHLGAAVAVPAGEHPWNDKRIYYVMEHMGKLREKGYFVRRPGSFQKQPCIVIEEEKFFYSDYDDQNPTRSIRIRTSTAPTGEALQRNEEVVIGEPGSETVTVESGEARIDASGYFGRSARIPVPPGVLFEVSGEYLAQQKPRQGATYSVSVIDRLARGVMTEHVEIIEQIGSNPVVWLAEFTSPGRPPMQVRFTADGRLLRLESSGLVYQVVGREDYERGRIPRHGPPPPPPTQANPINPLNDYDYDNVDFGGSYGGEPSTMAAVGSPFIPIGETVPAWDNFAWIILFAGPPHEWYSMITTSDYAQMDYTGVSATITAIRNAPRVDSQATFPMQVPPDIQPYLVHSEVVPSNQPAIIDAAYQAVADVDTKREETNVLRAVSYLAGWINQTVAQTEWAGYGSSASDALANRSGDSLAHARLFAAMARTLGIPTRVCQGLLAHTGRAVHHCWAEAWINGVWIPVDTTVSRVGLPAGYVLAERAMGDGAFQFDFAQFMRQRGLTLTLASAGRDTPNGQVAELTVGDRRTYAYAEDDWLANLYWGFALRLPPEWLGSARLNSVEMSSPDRKASVKCEALAGDYGAGKAELDSNIASLRSNLGKFKLVDSRVVSFDPDGATPALFMDFTCTQDGVNLRCRQYVVPRRQRAFRISFWAEANDFNKYTASFDAILASFEF